MKLTRKAIKEGLDQVPIEAVLIGVNNPAGITLSPKDREFARQLALGESKASAYRKSRPSKAKPESQSRRGQDLAKKSAVVSQVEAFRLAIEAEKSRTPAHLRALVVQKLTEKALDPDIPPAQQIKALELLGKITEVALFTERREVVQVKDSGEIRARLMDSIRQAIKSSAVDAEIVEVDSLLAEINGDSHISTDNVTDSQDNEPGESHISSDNVTFTDEGTGDDLAVDSGDGAQNAGGATPPVGDPPNADDSQLPTVHSIPHIQSLTIDMHTESPTLDTTTIDSPTEVKE